MKKIDKIDGCHHCPFRMDMSTWNNKLYNVCYHPTTEGMDITGYFSIHPDCPLPDDINNVWEIKITDNKGTLIGTGELK